MIIDYKTSCAIFNYSFKLDGYYFNVVQIEDGKFDLKINSFFFKELKEAEEQGLLNSNNEGNKINEENLDVDNDENEDNEEYNINNGYKYKNSNNQNNYNESNNEEEEVDDNTQEKGLID